MLKDERKNAEDAKAGAINLMIGTGASRDLSTKAVELAQGGIMR